MNKCSPVEMRKNLQMVEQFKRVGVDFVAMPARNQEHKNQMIIQADKILDEIINEIDEEAEQGEL